MSLSTEFQSIVLVHIGWDIVGPRQGFLFPFHYHYFLLHSIDCFTLDIILSFYILQCCRHNADDEFDDQQVELAGGNVQLITTMASWEAKISESIKDHKIVSLQAICKIIQTFFKRTF